MKNSYVGIIIVALLLVLGCGYVLRQTYIERFQTAEIIKQNEADEPITFLCADAKTLTASFSEEEVRLTLADGQVLTLPIARSGSGFRYENETYSFIGKGSDASLLKQEQEVYANCVANSAHRDTGTNTYRFSDSGKTLQFTYPKEFIVSGGTIGYSTDWQQQSTVQGLVLVVATLPRSIAPQTNFSGATVSIGTSADPHAVSGCLHTGGVVQNSAVDIGGVTYAKITSRDAAAGNRYDTTSYRTVRNGQCYTVEYTIHTTVLENYSPEQHIREYDKAAVVTLLETLVQSVRFL